MYAHRCIGGNSGTGQRIVFSTHWNSWIVSSDSRLFFVLVLTFLVYCTCAVASLVEAFIDSLEVFTYTGSRTTKLLCDDLFSAKLSLRL